MKLEQALKKLSDDALSLLQRQCWTCRHWEVFKSNQQWGTCWAIHYPDRTVGEDWACMVADIEPNDAYDCLKSIEFETVREFGCVIWEAK